MNWQKNNLNSHFEQFDKESDPIFCMNRWVVFLFPKEVHRRQSDADEANKRSSFLERENKRCELQLGDLARQVGYCSLLLI